MPSFACKQCSQENKRTVFTGSTKNDAKIITQRHLIVDHGLEDFCSHKCNVCQKKFYDLSHFVNHIKTSAGCASFQMINDPLPRHMAIALTALVDQVMEPLDDQPPKAPSTPVDTVEIDSAAHSDTGSIRASSGEMKMDVSGTTDHEKSTDIRSKIGNRDISLTTPIGRSKTNSANVTTRSQTKSNGVSTAPMPESLRKASFAFEPEPQHDQQGSGSKRKMHIHASIDSKEKRGKLTDHRETPESDYGTPMTKEARNLNRTPLPTTLMTPKENAAIPITKWLDQCQLCKTLDNHHAPMSSVQEKKYHTYLHMKYTLKYGRMTEHAIRHHSDFDEFYKKCFEQGYFKEPAANRGM